MLLEYNNQIHFTSRYSSIKIDHFNLVLFPEFKNYFVTDDEGMDCFQKLYDGMSIGEAFEHYSSQFIDCTEEEIRQKYKNFLVILYMLINILSPLTLLMKSLILNLI